MGNTWADGIYRGLRKALGNACELHVFSMDGKRNQSTEAKQWVARQAVEEIERIKPDVLIVSDDDAARYLAVPYYKDTALPIVFSGLNWSVEEYGFPGQNATGIIETMPLMPMLRQAKRVTRGGEQATFLAANTMAAFKDFLRIQKQAQRLDVNVTTRFVETQQEWIQAYLELQSSEDFLILGSMADIRGWRHRDPKLIKTIQHGTRVPSFTTELSMVCYAVVGYVKVPEEHGRWSGLAALQVLQGVKAVEMPVVNSRHWDMWHSEALAAKVLKDFHRSLYLRAKKSNCL